MVLEELAIKQIQNGENLNRSLRRKIRSTHIQRGQFLLRYTAILTMQSYIWETDIGFEIPNVFKNLLRLLQFFEGEDDQLVRQCILGIRSRALC